MTIEIIIDMLIFVVMISSIAAISGSLVIMVCGLFNLHFSRRFEGILFNMGLYGSVATLFSSLVFVVFKYLGYIK